LVWRNRKKISQIIKDYFYLPFFLLIILWTKGLRGSNREHERASRMKREQEVAAGKELQKVFRGSKRE
jgi:hypothetical protein